MSPCPGSCNTVYRKAEAAYQTALAQWRQEAAEATDEGAEIPDLPEDHGVTPWPGQPTWCSRCQWTIRSRLLALDDLAAILQAGNDGHRPRSGGDRVSGSKTAPSPAPAVDLYDNLFSDLRDWENELRENLGAPPRPPNLTGNRSALALTTTIAWLAMHAERLLADADDGEAFGRSILTWHHRLEQATRTTPDRVRKPGRCPRCHTANLMLIDADRPADRRIECQSCQRNMTLDEYDALAADEAGTTGSTACG